jgi:hydroxymethylbilane synthase
VTRIRVGTRGSRLALIQAGRVAARLVRAHEGLEVELVEIRTTGDRIVDVPLGPGIGRSFFTKEIEDALLEGRIDVAVHSCKDLASVLPAGLALGAILPREDPRDALVTRATRADPAEGEAPAFGGAAVEAGRGDAVRADEPTAATGGDAGATGARTLASLPTGSVLGTASVRRKAFLALARPDLVLRDLRGNVPTRVAAVDEGRVDAAVLAAAGLERLGLGHRIAERLESDVMVPAAAQGAIAVQVREDDAAVRALVGALDDPPSRVEVTAERACLRRLEGGCQAPVGVRARAGADRLALRAAVVLDGRRHDVELEGPGGEAAELGERAAEALLGMIGADSLADAAARSVEPPGGSAPR